MMRYIFFLFFLFTQIQLWAQTSLKGIVNNYAKVTTIDTCTNKITLQNASAFAKNERVLMIQMKGAEINVANSAAFGNIFNYRGVGNYEVNTIDSVYGNTIVFKYKIINFYNTSFVTQLVSLPKYASALVIDTLKALKWDGNIGGIIALEADNLELNAPIDASGAGYRGGKALLSADLTNNCGWLFQVSDYFLPKNNWRGSEKGEGIADYVVNREWGRGAQATGGGGGNDHNAGGGGGANVAKGGNGGRNNDNDTFTCQGPNPGIGGKAIPLLNALNHLFLGGGGGAGHGNNGLATSGGAGGGIVFLIGKKLNANNHKILANGGDVATTLGDGSGGGGAGGTIVLDFEDISGALNVEAKGGKGGMIDNKGAQRCFGPGGGGAGGRVIYTSPLIVTGNFDGGTNGISTNGSCQNSPNSAEKGNDGYDELFPYLNIAKEPFLAAAITQQPMNDTVCIGSMATLKMKAKGVGLDYQWQVSNNGAAFSNLNNNAIYNGVQTPDLKILDIQKNIQNNEYQCVVTNECGEKLLTQKVKLYIDSLPKADFQIAINANQIICTNKSTGGDSYDWDFGDGTNSTFQNPTHLFTNDGKFTVELAVTNRCGVKFYSQVIEIVTPPKAGFKADSTIGCAPLTVVFNNTSSENVTVYKWTFAGGSPATSMDKNPSVTYLKSGVYGVTLEVANTKFSDKLVQNSFAIISEKPTSDFTFSAGLNANIIFKNTSSSNTQTYRWDFGNGIYSVNKDAIFDFVKDSTYKVTLTATNGCGSVQIVKDIKVETRPKAAFSANVLKGCVPFSVNFKSNASANTTQWIWRFPGAEKDTSSLQNPVVKYTKSGTYDVSLVVKNASGKDSIAQKGFIVVEDKPTANFDAKIDRLDVVFQNKSTNYKTLKWDFNDKGKVATEENPTHVFAQSGLYKVTLTATNACGTAQITKEFALTSRLDCAEITANIVPNPISEAAVLKFNAGRNAKMPFILSTIDGRVLKRGELEEDLLEFQFDFEGYAAGIYILYLKCDERVMTQRILKITY